MTLPLKGGRHETFAAAFCGRDQCTRAYGLRWRREQQLITADKRSSAFADARTYPHANAHTDPHADKRVPVDGRR